MTDHELQTMVKLRVENQLLRDAIKPFAEASQHAVREGNIGGAYDRIGREDLERAAKVLDLCDWTKS